MTPDDDVTPLEREVYEFVQDYTRTFQQPPHIELVAKEMRKRQASVWKATNCLVNKGYLMRERGRWASPILLK